MTDKNAAANVPFDFLIFIGRFQPFHKGHEFVVRKGLEAADKVIVFCGSAHQPRSIRNPWDIHEREQMIRSCFSEAENKRIAIVPLMDVAYNDELWVRNVQETVLGLVRAHHKQLHREPKIGLIGHSKDHTSYYLSLFPQWGSVALENYKGISATPIRDDLFTSQPHLADIVNLVPPNVGAYLEKFYKTKEYRYLCDEQQFVSTYKKSWENAPYAPTFVTVDGVVTQSGHILLVRRGARPGKGLLALPGGFINANEKIVDACLRELREETKLKIPAPVLRGSIKDMQVFDDPNRSSRGRTITHAFHIALAPDTHLPKVKGSDDAKEAFWAPLGELDPSLMFEDHYFIIQKILGTL